MKLIPLTQGMFAKVSDEDYELVSKFKWHAHRMGKSGIVYAGHSVKVNGRYTSQHMHTFILGKPGKGFEIDHISGDGLDNQRENMRVCTHSKNMCNQKKRKSNTTAKCVYFNSKSKRFRARIHVNGKRLQIGCFKDEVSAIKAYNDAALKYFGEFARLNII